MPTDSFYKKMDELSRQIGDLTALSLSRPDKPDNKIQDALLQISLSMEALATLAGGGHDRGGEGGRG